MGAYWLGATVAFTFLAIVAIGLVRILFVKGGRYSGNVKGSEVSTCLICRDESDEVCPHCGNRGTHDRLVAEMEALGG
jgi:hypothetical protein